MLATFTLTVPESKRLIAQGVVELPEIKEIKGEPKLKPNKKDCGQCSKQCSYVKE